MPITICKPVLLEMTFSEQKFSKQMCVIKPLWMNSWYDIECVKLQWPICAEKCFMSFLSKKKLLSNSPKKSRASREMSADDCSPCVFISEFFQACRENKKWKQLNQRMSQFWRLLFFSFFLAVKQKMFHPGSCRCHLKNNEWFSYLSMRIPRYFLKCLQLHLWLSQQISFHFCLLL